MSSTDHNEEPSLPVPPTQAETESVFEMMTEASRGRTLEEAMAFAAFAAIEDKEKADQRAWFRARCDVGNEWLERVTALSPEGLGTGPIDNVAMPFWRRETGNDKEIVLPSGRILAGNVDSYGVSDDLSVYSGYDEAVRLAGKDENTCWDEDDTTHLLSYADQIALAEIMIERWQRLIVKAKAGIK